MDRNVIPNKKIHAIKGKSSTFRLFFEKSDFEREDRTHSRPRFAGGAHSCASVGELVLAHHHLTARREGRRMRKNRDVSSGVASLLGELACTSSTGHLTTGRERRGEKKKRKI